MNNDWKFWFKLGVAVMLLFATLGAVGYVLGWFGEAGSVVQKEFGPDAALTKYEWFIDQANAIEKADADIKLFEQRLADVETRYTSTYGADKIKWSLAIQVQYNREMQTARDDLLAIVSNRNNLVKEYNAQSEKFNWAPFKTRADMPPQTFEEYVVD